MCGTWKQLSSNMANYRVSFILPWITPGLAHIIMSKIPIMMPGTVLSMLKGLT